MGAMVKGFSKLDSNSLSIVKVNTWLDSYLLLDGKLFSTFTKVPAK